MIMIACLTDCTPARFVKPLEKNEWAIGANAGGPLIDLFGTKLPVPFSSLYAGYGKTDRLTIHGGLHTTSLAYKTLQLDAGASYLIINSAGSIPGISVNGTLNGMFDFREYNARVYPNLAGNLFWDDKYGRFYCGMENWIDPFKNGVPDNSTYKPWTPAFYLGETLKLNKWEVTFEYKNLAPYTSNRGHVVQYARSGKKGAHGIYLSIQKRFGG
ncbi:hypothetical protein GCM10007940_18380 [Portibacter lacus]|uniref:Uncharacterized protein n=2 Tax=Portibacter lacus TaxID=1099794 RepID=A0AA37SS64_9BACT|nr:hypothetical protein GCM10007940_18380 [Portibacter lacus]